MGYLSHHWNGGDISINTWCVIMSNQQLPDVWCFTKLFGHVWTFHKSTGARPRFHIHQSQLLMGQTWSNPFILMIKRNRNHCSYQFHHRYHMWWWYQIINATINIKITINSWCRWNPNVWWWNPHHWMQKKAVATGPRLSTRQIQADFSLLSAPGYASVWHWSRIPRPRGSGDELVIL